MKKINDAALVVGQSGHDCGPFCDEQCAATRNGHPVTVRAMSEVEADETTTHCRHCGAQLFDDDES